jgi:hypothetical protein
MVAAAGVAAVPSIGAPGILAAMVALLGDTPTMHGGAIMTAGEVVSAMTSVSGMTTLTAVTIAGSTALSVMASPIMTTMGTTREDAIGFTAEHSSPAAPIGGTATTLVSTTTRRRHCQSIRDAEDRTPQRSIAGERRAWCRLAGFAARHLLLRLRQIRLPALSGHCGGLGRALSITTRLLLRSVNYSDRSDCQRPPRFLSLCTCCPMASVCSCAKFCVASVRTVSIPRPASK